MRNARRFLVSFDSVMTRPSRRVVASPGAPLVAARRGARIITSDRGAGESLSFSFGHTESFVIRNFRLFVHCTFRLEAGKFRHTKPLDIR